MRRQSSSCIIIHMQLQKMDMADSHLDHHGVATPRRGFYSRKDTVSTPPINSGSRRERNNSISTPLDHHGVATPRRGFYSRKDTVSTPPINSGSRRERNNSISTPGYGNNYAHGPRNHPSYYGPGDTLPVMSRGGFKSWVSIAT